MFHRAATQLDFQRFRRRCRTRRPWEFGKDEKGIGYQQLEVSSDNKQFLKELVEDRYYFVSIEDFVKDSYFKTLVNPWVERRILCPDQRMFASGQIQKLGTLRLD